MYNQNLIYQIGLTLVKGIGCITAKHILKVLENAELLFKEKASVLCKIQGVTPKIISEIKNPEILNRAEKEILFMEKNDVKPLFFSDDCYPQRLKDCIDSPVMLFLKGNVDLNADKVVSIVGTRNATVYGKEVTEKLLVDFSEKYPEIIIISGLAYGIDIAAHKAALKENISTVGVLAHGLDRIYPYMHKEIAQNMQMNGGIISEFMSETNPDRQNFVKRNRIIAGLSDCTIVVESGMKGGALITADIADSYGRDVFAIPGRTTDVYSKGCNLLIQNMKALLAKNVEDIIYGMSWERPTKNNRLPVQKDLFLDLTEEERKIIDHLATKGMEHINILNVMMNIPIAKLSTILFELEMKGLIKTKPGGIYQLF